MARIGRRRRVLSEEARTSSNKIAGYCPTPSDDIDAPRYGCQANIENHPQVTDFVPRRYRTIALVVAMGVLLTTTAGTLAYFAQDLSRMLQVVSAEAIRSQFSAGIVAWTSSIVLLLTACFARVLFSLRRHRVADYRGRYRVWRMAAWASVALSINAVVGVHTLAATLLTHFTGWNPLAIPAIWWLAPAALLGSWLLVKLTRDVSECRTALAANLLGIGCFAIAAAAVLGWAPESLASMPNLLTTSIPLLGFTLLLAGTMLYARYVVLDVQGLIAHVSIKNVPAEKATPAAEPLESKEAPVVEKTTQWLDGSEGSEESGAAEAYEGKRRLSKADRKRLRKQKQRNRAA